MSAVDIRTMVPRVRRAVEGVAPTAGTSLTDSQVKDLTADALAALILYTTSSFGRTLDVTAVDGNGSPEEYSLSGAMSLPEQTAVAAQAALDYFFFLFAGMKVVETLQDEASTWTYELSPSLLTTQMKLLADTRDKAIEAMDVELGGVLDSYVSFIGVRDMETARLIEGYYSPVEPGGHTQVEFGGYGPGYRGIGLIGP